MITEPDPDNERCNHFKILEVGKFVVHSVLFYRALISF